MVLICPAPACLKGADSLCFSFNIPVVIIAAFTGMAVPDCLQVRSGKEARKRKTKECKMVINHNMSAINANRTLKFSHWRVNSSMEKLSSGERINKAGDDASGLAVSEKMRTQINGLTGGEKYRGRMSFARQQKGILNQTSMNIQRIRVLAVQSATEFTPIAIDSSFG
jgi:hypothetical protein